MDNAYWKTIMNTMADGLMIVNTEGKILSINHAMETLTGYRQGDLVGKSCRVLNCDHCNRERAQGDEHFCALFKEGRIRRSKCTLRKKDGKLVHVRKNASVLKDDTGAIIGGVETLSDISASIAQETMICDLRRELTSWEGFHGMIGTSAAMQQVYYLITSTAQSDAPVIIYGESGTGKELAAQAIHDLSARKNGPFVKINCAALNESLLESELFGHVKGAFTGADRNRIGRFEAADTGNIFLDEIAEIPLSTQVKLLRVLQEHEIERVGDHRSISIDVRIIAATNKDLLDMTRRELFREDLYYRINVIPIHLPPLRERPEDIPQLINTFIRRIQEKTRKDISGMANDTLHLLNAYPWPGNIRELINVIEYAFVLCPGGVITPAHLPPNMTGRPAPDRTSLMVSGDNRADPHEEKQDDRQALINSMAQAGGNKSEAARMLGISRVSLYKRLKKYGIRMERSMDVGKT